jgi:ABC-type glycerol-3-phosphate transport system substrate-binding protein
MLAGYRRLHPGVTLKILPLPPGDPTVWEQSLLAAGSAPDILVPPYTMAVFNDLPKHYWLDLTPYLSQPSPYVQGNRHWIDTFDPAINGQNAFTGRRYYVISWSAQDAAFFYNKDIFHKAGISHAPTTWAEMLADSARITKAGYIPVGYDLGDTYPIAENGSFISEVENQLMSATLHKLDTNHDGIVDIKELVYGIKHRTYSPMNADYQEAWKLFKDWSRYWEPNAAGVKPVSFQETVALFFQGKAGMMYSTQEGGPALTQDKVKFHWGVFKMPQITPASSRFATPAQKNVGIWGAWNADAFSIPVTTKSRGHLNLALDFLHWITAPQNDVPVCLENGYLPVVKGWHAADPYNALFYDLIQHPSMQFVAEATLGPEWLKSRIATQQAYITGQESLQQAMADMQRYTDQAADKIVKIYHFSA